MMWGDHGMGWGWSGAWGIFGVIHMLLWWVLIVVLIVFLLKWIGGRSRARGRHGEDSAIRILRERYARGEIGKEEFEQRKRDLSG